MNDKLNNKIIDFNPLIRPKKLWKNKKQMKIYKKLRKAFLKSKKESE